MEPAYINVSEMFIASSFGLPASPGFDMGLPAYQRPEANLVYRVAESSLLRQAITSPPPGLEKITPSPPPGLSPPQLVKGFGQTRPARTSSNFSSLKTRTSSQLSMVSTAAGDIDSLSECEKSDDADTTVGDNSEVVEKNIGSGDVGGLEIGKDDVRMLMIMNIPGRCTQQEMMDVLAAKGFDKDCTFFHMPFFTSKKRVHHKGYAFVGFPDMHITARFASEMAGHRFTRGQSLKTCKVAPAHIQDMNTILQDLALKGTKHHAHPWAKRCQTEHFQ
jgi:hypothetical protein